MNIEDYPRADLHVHAAWYRNKGKQDDMKVADIILRCQELQLDAVGVVSHLHQGSEYEPLLAEMVDESSHLTPSIRTWLGAELDILGPGGKITGSQTLCDQLKLDYTLAAMHGGSPDCRSVKDFNNIYLRWVMDCLEQCDFVDIIAHPWQAGFKSVPSWSFDSIPAEHLNLFFRTIRDSGRAIEMNISFAPIFDDRSFIAFWRQAADEGVEVTAVSDAHDLASLGQADKSLAFLASVDYPPELVRTDPRQKPCR